MEEIKVKNNCEPSSKDEQDNSITSFNIGSSDYSKMNIQPWDLWLYFNDGWRCDIIKRLLRHKKSSIFDRIFHPFTCDSRINDYRKIKHIILKIEDVYFNTTFRFNDVAKSVTERQSQFLSLLLQESSNNLNPIEYKILSLLLSIDYGNLQELKAYIDILIGAEVNDHLYYKIIEKFSNKRFNFNIMQNELIKILVEFGNYLLSDERRNTIINEDNLNFVTDADISNFLSKDNNEK